MTETNKQDLETTSATISEFPNKVQVWLNKAQELGLVVKLIKREYITIDAMTAVISRPTITTKPDDWSAYSYNQETLLICVNRSKPGYSMNTRWSIGVSACGIGVAGFKELKQVQVLPLIQEYADTYTKFLTNHTE